MSELYADIVGRRDFPDEVIFCRYSQISPPTIEHHLLLPLDVASLSATQPQQAPAHMCSSKSSWPDLHF
jgi:hypothetical protein